ncbi:hypothetical protein [Chryseobacterium contaminans]|uniref:hypothetical protein n=1 Tax=Chryseobacterium contaminans TaxID=1423959 RepID=UPI0030199AFF
MIHFKKFIAIVFFHCILLSYSQYKEVNITSFKVNGNDKIDDTQNFDTAIEYVSKNGGTLYIPKGNYYLDNKKRIRKGVHNNSYIFLVNNNFKIKLDKEAILYYKNDFKGFRFRTVENPNSKTINKYNVEIDGGVVDCSNNLGLKVKNNPEVWAFLGETLRSFKVTNLTVRNLYGTAGIGAGFNDFVEINNNNFQNVTGNPSDYIDNHGDAIYISNTKSYNVKDNRIVISLNETKRLGRVGICIEDKVGNGTISNNFVSGYDRGVHVELITGTSTIFKNELIGNSSGIVLWNNNGYKQIIDTNIINNKGLSKSSKPFLYTSAPILLLGYDSNLGTIIRNNIIIIDKDYFIPDELLQVTSSNTEIYNNSFSDPSKTLSLSIAQGKSNKERVRNVSFNDNKVLAKNINVYDSSSINVSNNQFDITDAVFSFDNTENIYKNNIFSKTLSSKKVQIFGKFKK